MNRQESSKSRANTRIETASESLEGRLSIVIDDPGWREFQEILKRPVEHKPQLARLLSESGVLD